MLTLFVRDVINHYEKRIKDLEARIEYLERENEELRKRLQLYENPHTPPSKLRKYVKKKEKKTPKKLGAPKGHKKYERKTSKPTELAMYKEDSCPYCNSKLGKPFKIERVIEEEIPEPQPIRVIKHVIPHYKCPNCKRHVVAKNKAPKGRFGKNLSAHIALMKFEDRLPFRKISNTLERLYGIKISDVGIYKVINRVANSLSKSYQEIIERIKKSKVVYIDETEIKIDGRAYYLWTFTTYKDCVYVIRKSRRKKVISEILGDNYKGIIVCDGWKAYSMYSNNLQRCWAHLLREAKSLSERYLEFSYYYDELRGIYMQVKEIAKKPPPLGEREDLRDKLRRKMIELGDKMSMHSEFQKFATKIKNGLEHWFTCVIKTFVEPTNNIAERALRELIVQRKIFGGLRREKGARIMEVITSVISSVRMQGGNVFEFIKGCLWSG